jgi:lactate dehydrogenase-like 2-hydroxyacid dehydrogenase
MSTVAVTRDIPVAGLELIQGSCTTRVWPEQMPPTPDALRDFVRGCDGILALITDRIDGSVMEAAGPQLRVISNLAVGVDNVDIAEATRRGIPVGNTPGVLTETTADLTWALLMAAARRIAEGEHFVRDGLWRTWEPTFMLGYDVYGATLGIVGFGRIGRAVARRAQGFGMSVLYASRSAAAEEDGARRVDLDTLLRESDFVSLHVPLTPETYHLIDAAALRRMKPTAILVNAARGGVVDPHALYEALRDGVIAAAALDVTEPEPITIEEPLLTMANCLIVPHLGSASIATRGRMAEMAARNILAGIAGQPLPTCVNPQVYASSS